MKDQRSSKLGPHAHAQSDPIPKGDPPVDTCIKRTSVHVNSGGKIEMSQLIQTANGKCELDALTNIIKLISSESAGCTGMANTKSWSDN